MFFFIALRTGFLCNARHGINWQFSVYLRFSGSQCSYHKLSRSNSSSGTGTFQKLNALNCAFSSFDGELCEVSSSEKSITLLPEDRNSSSSNSMSGRTGFQKLNSVNSEAIAYKEELKQWPLLSLVEERLKIVVIVEWNIWHNAKTVQFL